MHGSSGSGTQARPIPEQGTPVWARYFANQSLPVFPLNPNCRSPGDHARIQHGMSGASTDPEQIRRFWEGCPDAGIGIPTGAQSGLVVLVIDARNGGDNSYAQLQQQMPEGTFNKLLKVKSSSGETHLWFRCEGDPIPSCTSICQGISVKGTSNNNIFVG